MRVARRRERRRQDLRRRGAGQDGDDSAAGGGRRRMPADRRRRAASAGAAARPDDRPRGRRRARATATLFGNRARVLAAIEPNVSRVPGFADCPAAGGTARRTRPGPGCSPTSAKPSPRLPRSGRCSCARRPAMGGRPDAGIPSHDPRRSFSNAMRCSCSGRSVPRSNRDVCAKCSALQSIARFDLGRLDAAAVGAMVGDMLALTDPPREFVEFVTTQSEGNPFFVAEYLRTAVAERLLQRTARTLESSATQDRGRRRLRTTGAACVAPRAGRHAAWPACPIARWRWRRSRPFLAAKWMRCCSWSLPDARSGAMDAIRELGARQVLDRAEGGRYRFLHDKLRETAYANIPADHRPVLPPPGGEQPRSRVWPDRTNSHDSRGAWRSTTNAPAIGHAPSSIWSAPRSTRQAFADREVADYLTSALRLDDEQGKRIAARARTAWRTSCRDGAPRAWRARTAHGGARASTRGSAGIPCRPARASRCPDTSSAS